MRIEIWSDVVCPWCAIGRANLHRTLDDLPDRDDIELRYRSFELDPDAPQERTGDYAELLGRKYGTGREGAQQMIDRMAATGAEAGVEFRFDIARPGNTFDAHRLLHLAGDRGVQDDLKGRLMHAYAAEGTPIGRHEALQQLAVEVGLPSDEVRDTLASDRYADAVRADEVRARKLGITGVPFFLVDGQFGLPGAQPPRLLRKVIDHARSAASDPETATEDDD